MFLQALTFGSLFLLGQIHASTNVEHRVFFKDNTFNIIVNQIKDINLYLKPELKPDDHEVEVKFACQSSDDNSRIWNLTDNHCSILNVTTGYKYKFTSIHNSSVSLSIKGTKPGKIQLVGNTEDPNNVDDSKAFLTINVGLSDTILLISSIVGWIYFAVWSVSFYPQIYENWKHKSCAGLNIDYAMLNIMGFLSYTVFNISLYYIKTVQSEYEVKHPRSQIPVEFNDVVFAVHALICCSIIVSHYFIYDRGEQTLSIFARIFLIVACLLYFVLIILVCFTKYVALLELVYIASYVKLAVTLIKYIPQGYYNYQRKSTVGWSILNIFLDTTGGALSMIQMFMLAYNYDDWATIFNNFTKFGLGLTSILFDLFFFVQHYILYPHGKNLSVSSLIEDGNGPTIRDARIRKVHDDIEH